ncbi:hypothetical protein HDU97_009353 [Phlyctochytrium planicorne]|nr:hypothetical protein HDU97_009353 [Phlyctochytrium planicorne]
MVNRSIREAGESKDEKSPVGKSPVMEDLDDFMLDPKDPLYVKKTNVLYAIMTLLSELDPISLRVVQHKVNMMVEKGGAGGDK